MNRQALQQAREFLKDTIRQRVDFAGTDQNRNVPPPPVQKPCPSAAKRIPLPRRDSWTHVQSSDLFDAIAHRESRRDYRSTALQIDEVAFLLWATQGIRRVINPAVALRTVPSAGARHPLETYLCVLNMDTVASGIYRYLPIEHELAHVADVEHLSARLTEGALGQSFAGQSAVTFVWTAIPYRTEWRYGLASHKVIALDAGHVCQNLYLACDAVGCGTCAIAAYDQAAMDRLLGVDGEDEFVVYMAPVGRVRDRS